MNQAKVCLMHRSPTFRPRWYTVITIAWLTVFTTVFGCSGNSTDVEDNTGTDQPIYITDIDGGKWNISHAIYYYGFNLEGFSSGKGPYARPPIIDPEMISPGEPGYPPDGATMRVIATYVGEEGRAYPIDAIARNEVVDDRAAGKPITVAY
jgi:hypothetical protein